MAAYRRTGADVPFGDPLPSHGTEMEGWFWRLTDPATGRVVVALCGVNRHPSGDWATVAVAAHPGEIVHSAVLDLAEASADRLLLSAGAPDGDRIDASADELHIALGGLRLDLAFEDSFDWPKGLGGGGLFSALPFLNQYWHPYRLGGTATGRLELDGETWPLADATVYAERNWGKGFPDLWWWGQAHDFPGEDLSVVFTGGLLSLGPISHQVGGVVVRHGDQVIRITPPALVHSEITPDRWVITARSPRYRIQLEGTGRGVAPHVLPVPIPAERRNVDNDFEHLAGRLRCIVHRRGELIVDATSELAGLEIGSLPGVDLPGQPR